MAKGVTLADVYTVYVKPSLHGELVIRKKTSKQTSPVLKEWKEMFAKLKPGKEAYQLCPNEDKYKAIKYTANGPVLVDRCRIRAFRASLRQVLTEFAKSNAPYHSQLENLKRQLSIRP